MGSYSSAAGKSCSNTAFPLYGRTRRGNIKKNGGFKLKSPEEGRFGRHRAPKTRRCSFIEPVKGLLISGIVIESSRRPTAVVGMRPSGKSRFKPGNRLINMIPVARLDVLNEQEIELIHAGAMCVLANPGIRVDDGQLRRLMADYGCEVDEGSGFVRFPQSLVEELLDNVPERFSVMDRACGAEVIIGDGVTHFASGQGACYMFEPHKKERKPITKNDLKRFTKLSHCLGGIELVSPGGFPQDVESHKAFAVAVKILLSNTTKPLILAPFVAEDARVAMNLIETVGSEDSQRYWICQQSMRSPLILPAEMAAVMQTVIPAGIPMLLHTAHQTGLTGPYSLAGLIVQYNAEMLSALITTQMIKKGAPVLYGGGWGTSDMKTLQRHLASPEAALLRAAGAQLARKYRVPYHSLGPDSDSHTPDQRSSWEKMLTCLAAAMSGADLVINAGMFSTGMNQSLAQLVMDNEIIEVVKSFVKGIDVNEDRLSVSLIQNIGPDGN